MALPYRKWTDSEIQERNVVEDGDYPFIIIDASMRKTKPGLDKNGQQKLIYDMMEVEFEFKDKNGVIKKQKDWIVFMDGIDWKLRHLASTTGNIELYDADELDCHHLRSKRGIFSLGIKDFTGTDGIKKKMNFVKDYVKLDQQKSIQREAPEQISKPGITKDDFINDDIPF